MNNHQPRTFGALAGSLKGARSTAFRLGDLLLRAGLVNEGVLNEAMRLSGSATQKVGDMLVLAGHITEFELSAAITAGENAQEPGSDYPTIVRALRMASRCRISFVEALAQLRRDSLPSLQSSRLGEFLVESGVISQEELSRALLKSSSTGLPLGRVLVSAGVISESFLAAALNAQVLIRDGRLTRPVAAHALSIAHRRRLPVGRFSRSLSSRDARTVKFGELVAAAGLASEMDVGNAVEVGLEQSMPVGETLCRQGIISRRILDIALKLQIEVRNGSVSLDTAIERLKIEHLIDQAAQYGSEGGDLLRQTLTRLPSIDRLPGGPQADSAKWNERAHPPAPIESGGINNIPVQGGQELPAQSKTAIPEILNSWFPEGKSPGSLVQPHQGIGSPDEVNADRTTIGPPAGKQEAAGDDAAVTSETVSGTSVELLPSASSGDRKERAPEEQRYEASGAGMNQRQEIASSEQPPFPGLCDADITFEKFVECARLASRQDLVDALEFSRKSPVVIAKAVQITGVLDDTALALVLKCYFVARKGWLTMKQAAEAVEYCLKKMSAENLSVADAFESLGWEKGMWQCYLYYRDDIVSSEPPGELVHKTTESAAQ